MGTLADLKSRIASELNRSDLTTHIAAEIPRAIERYAAQRFWFNETTETAATVAGATLALGTPGPRIIDLVQITVGSSSYPLDPHPLVTIQEWLGFSPSQGQPTAYAMEGGTFVFYPTPNDAYTLSVTGVFDLDALSMDTDTNAWTTEAEDLICYDVVERLARTKTRNAALAADARGLKGDAQRQLRAETTRRLSTGLMPG